MFSCWREERGRRNVSGLTEEWINDACSHHCQCCQNTCSGVDPGYHRDLHKLHSEVLGHLYAISLDAYYTCNRSDCPRWIKEMTCPFVIGTWWCLQWHYNSYNIARWVWNQKWQVAFLWKTSLRNHRGRTRQTKVRQLTSLCYRVDGIGMFIPILEISLSCRHGRC